MLNYILPQIRKRNHAALHFTKEINVSLKRQNLFVIKIIKLTPLQAIFPIFVKS